jgi:hypothetical protein
MAHGEQVPIASEASSRKKAIEKTTSSGADWDRARLDRASMESVG